MAFSQKSNHLRHIGSVRETKNSEKCEKSRESFDNKKYLDIHVKHGRQQYISKSIVSNETLKIAESGNFNESNSQRVHGVQQKEHT